MPYGSIKVDSIVGTSKTVTVANIVESGAIGTTVQPYDAQLADVAGLTPGNGSIIIGNGTNFVTQSGSTARASLGLAIGTDVQAYDATYLKSADIGTSIQGYDADTAKLDVAQTFTAAQTFSGGISDSAGSLRRLPQNAQTTSYTLVASDTGKHISITGGGVTIPAGVMSIGDVVTIFNDSSSTQSISQDSGVTLRKADSTSTGNFSLSNYGIATVLCVASNTFVISGVGLN